MSEHFDDLEIRDPETRERDQVARLPAVVAAAKRSALYADALSQVDPSQIYNHETLGKLPITRKSDMPALQKQHLPFGGLPDDSFRHFKRIFMSPGPIFEPQQKDSRVWSGARAMHAAGFRQSDMVLNTFSYHLTPAGFVMDASAEELGCIVIPAGPGNKEQQLDLIEALQPIAYAGTPDFLKILLDAAEEKRRGSFPVKKAVVSGAAFPPSLQKTLGDAGIDAYQNYGTAEFGIVAFETASRDGMVIGEDVIVEIVRPGSNHPVAEGEVGEVVVTSLSPNYPLLRIALGDLSVTVPGHAGSGHTNQRIRGWLGRVDQATKVKGMFVRPEQIQLIAERLPALLKLRLVVTRSNELDQMLLKAEAETPEDASLFEAASNALKEITKLSGKVELVSARTLPNDGKIIEDLRS
ncbi:MAG: AMP-binding protein [Xanthobacteraceae bacterium]|nr:AMP-binding protein [Xanthobacteraceae bacterium]